MDEAGESQNCPETEVVPYSNLYCQDHPYSSLTISKVDILCPYNMDEKILLVQAMSIYLDL